MSRTQALAEISRDLTERVDSLSDRQRTALQLRGSGMSCKEAAAQMGIGYDAFKDLCFRARTKLGASNTPEAAALMSQAEATRLRLAIHRARETLMRQTQHNPLTHQAMTILDGAVHA